MPDDLGGRKTLMPENTDTWNSSTNTFPISRRAAAADRRAVRSLRRLRRQDQRRLAQGLRPALPASRAALARHREGVRVRRRGAHPRRGGAAADSLPCRWRSSFPGRTSPPRIRSARRSRWSKGRQSARAAEPDAPLRAGRDPRRAFRLRRFARRDGHAGVPETTWNRIERGQAGSLPNGVLYLKGAIWPRNWPSRESGGMFTTFPASSTNRSSKPRRSFIRLRNRCLAVFSAGRSPSAERRRAVWSPV